MSKLNTPQSVLNKYPTVSVLSRHPINSVLKQTPHKNSALNRNPIRNILNKSPPPQETASYVDNQQQL